MIIHQRHSPNYGHRNGADVDVLVLHHTASGSGTGDLAWMCNNASKVSAHYLIDRDGTIYQLVHEGLAAWHAGKCELRGQPTNMNARSIGIELANRGNGAEPFTEAQYLALEWLVLQVVLRHAIPPENVVGHRDIAVPVGRKTDPADNFDWPRVRRVVGLDRAA